MATKNEIFDRFKEEYRTANRKRKSEILNTVTSVTGLRRKSVVVRFRTLQRDRMRKSGEEAADLLLRMKEHTVRRRVSSFDKARKKGKGLSGTKPSILKSIIPIFKGLRKGLYSGHGRIDTAAHCNNSLLGDFIWSLNCTDAETFG